MQRIFVFGSNLAGRHGKGSALEAVKNHGARLGIGYGLQGNSYGIPTKDRRLQVMPISEITPYVNQFVWFTTIHNDLQFDVVEIGCGLSGYSPEQIAPLFANCRWLRNVSLPQRFNQVLGFS